MVPYISPNRVRTGIPSNHKGINYFLCSSNLSRKHSLNGKFKYFSSAQKNTLTLKSEGKHTRTHI